MRHGQRYFKLTEKEDEKNQDLAFTEKFCK